MIAKKPTQKQRETRLEAYLLGIGDEWLIDWAKAGDRQLLADAVRSGLALERPRLREFVADVLEGKVKIKRPIKLGFKARAFAHQKERRVAFRVAAEMDRRGKRRDEALRTRLTLEYCEAEGIEPWQVERYLKHHHHNEPVKRRATNK